MSSMFEKPLLLSETIETFSFYNGYRLKTITHGNLTSYQGGPIVVKVVEYQHIVNNVVPVVDYIVSVYGVNCNGELHTFPSLKAISAVKEENRAVISLDFVGPVNANPEHIIFVATVCIKIVHIGFPEIYALNARFDDEMTFRKQTHFI